MPINVERLPDQPILVVEALEPLDIAAETPAMIDRVAQEVGATSGKLYIIYDASDLKIAFSDMLFGLAEHAHRSEGSVRDTHTVTIVVGTDEMLKLAVEALKQPQYGEVSLPMFDSRDKALAYAREHIAAATLA